MNRKQTIAIVLAVLLLAFFIVALLVWHNPSKYESPGAGTTTSPAPPSTPGSATTPAPNTTVSPTPFP